MFSSILANSSPGSIALIIALIIVVLLVLFFLSVLFVARLKKCPPDQIIVVYGRIGKHSASRCRHGGITFIWPIIQDYGYISLRPMQLDINLKNALCHDNIRINMPCVFTVGIGTDEVLMRNAADRVLGLRQESIADLSKEIVLGQIRLVIASMSFEQIKSDRDSFLRNIKERVSTELNTLGLMILNVNITDISEEGDYTLPHRARFMRASGYFNTKKHV